MDSEITNLEEILPCSHTRDVELVPMFYFEVQKKVAKDALFIMKDYINKELYDKYNHLKRCKKCSDSVQILIGTCNHIPFELSQKLIEKIKQENNNDESNDLIISKIMVSKYAPITRKQYVEWSIHWPLYYRKPDKDILILKKEEINKYIKFINISINIGKQFGTCNSGCVITYNDQIIASSGDNIKNHPLQHAPMLAIEQVSYKLRHIWLNKQKEKTNLQKKIKIIQKETNKCDILKNEQKNENNKNHTLLPNFQNDNNQNNHNILLDNISNDQYLCTNFYAFLSHEPCYMCAMALLHSRIKCVIFDKQNINNGALMSQEKLHCIKSLNHHFKVFKTIRG
ncbi:cytidine deaminase, putative [Plasmodium gaboni]|uniref:Cytidine deaminase, putative n=1 Tax=Plasmodium gaboni TaxID=647221 RepID=A0ABY1UTB5_9APIC|nr:cytidine deaminase, putative [Plasmodium gaboni]